MIYIYMYNYDIYILYIITYFNHLQSTAGCPIIRRLVLKYPKVDIPVSPIKSL